MLFNVPQDIGVEDKIVGPFTAKQLGWIGGVIVVGAVIWMSNSSKISAILLILPIVLFSAAAAFYRPYGQPFIGFISYTAYYLVKPKIYVWKRIIEKSKTIRAKDKKKEEKKAPKDISLKEIEALARSLDSGGKERSEKVLEILRKKERSRRNLFGL